MPNHEIRLPSLHPGQKRVLSEKKRKNFLCCGRGWWKSSLATRLAIESLLEGLPFGWYAPTMKPILDNWSLMQKVLGYETFSEWINKSDNVLRMPGGEAGFYYSLEIPSNSAGPTFPRIYVEEAGSLPDGVYTSVIEPIFEKAMVAYGNAELWMFGTPNRDGNPKNDFWRLINLARDDEDSASWVAPTLGAKVTSDGLHLVREPSPYENPNYNFDRFASSYRASPRKKSWRIEYLCEFLSDEGGQFGSVEQACCLPTVSGNASGEFVLQNYSSSGYSSYVTGVDIGIRNDFTVISVMDTSLRKQVYLRRFLPGEWGPVYDAIRRVKKLYPGQMNLDATGGGSHVKETMYGVDSFEINEVKFNQLNKPVIMDNLSSLMESHQIELLNVPDQVFELNMVGRKARSTGGYDIRAVKGAHDDIPIATALSCMGIKREIETVSDWLMSEPAPAASPYASVIW